MARKIKNVENIITSKVGRRKTATANVYIKKGTGNIVINKKTIDKYFPSNIFKEEILKPLILLNCADKYDLCVNVKGGGFRGQSEAIRLGISRNLADVNEEYRLALRKAGLLTRDDRSVESKKPGLKKARKETQFRKR